MEHAQNLVPRIPDRDRERQCGDKTVFSHTKLYCLLLQACLSKDKKAISIIVLENLLQDTGFYLKLI